MNTRPVSIKAPAMPYGMLMKRSDTLYIGQGWLGLSSCVRWNRDKTSSLLVAWAGTSEYVAGERWNREKSASDKLLQCSVLDSN